MNKITGLLLFLLPLTIPYFELNYIAIFVCSIATISAVQEGFCVITGSDAK
jgi:CDP-diacylglycerol--glycerol-3-phosphate 3-phosphatidyltransferase